MAMFFFMYFQKMKKKNEKKFGGLEKNVYLCTRLRESEGD